MININKININKILFNGFIALILIILLNVLYQEKFATAMNHETITGIYVTTNPSEADVYLDDVLQGLSPIFINNVTIGNHTIKAAKAGYRDNIQNVEVIENITVNLGLNLTQYSGALNITTNPSEADVYLDDVLQGLSPMLIEGIVVGTHVVKATKTAYTDMLQTIDLVADQITNVAISLEPLNNQTNQTNLTQETQHGIYVVTEPVGAHVFVDNIWKGRSPITIIDLEPGIHTVMVLKRNYYGVLNDINLEQNELTNLNLVLNPKPATLEIVTNPEGANVYLDGVFQGISPITINNIVPGNHELIATKTDYRDLSLNQEIGPGQTDSASLVLLPYTYSCSNTDNGLNYGSQGTTLIIRSDNSIMRSAIEFCKDSKTLVEYYCSSQTLDIAKNVVRCSGSCANGKCV